MFIHPSFNAELNRQRLDLHRKQQEMLEAFYRSKTQEVTPVAAIENSSNYSHLFKPDTERLPIIDIEV